MEASLKDIKRRLHGRLKMRHLLLLLQIQKHGNLTRAAEHMASSQPAMTNTLAEIEDMFGGQLFDRSPRGMTPTPLGHIVLARAQSMVHDLDHLVSDVDSLATRQSTRLHIGVIPFISLRKLAQAVHATQTQSVVRVSARIHEGSSEALMTQLMDHRLDIVVGRMMPHSDYGRLRLDVLHQQTPRLVAGRQLAAQLSRRKVNWQMLLELDWILGAPDTPMREQIADLFMRAGATPPEPLVESHATRLIGEMLVANEKAVSIVPADIAEELVHVAGVAIVPYTLEWMLPPVAVFTRAERASRDIDMAFVRVLEGLYR